MIHFVAQFYGFIFGVGHSVLDKASDYQPARVLH